MDTKEGIPLWEFIKPKPQNRLHEIENLLLFYSEYQDQIDQSSDHFDLFLSELLYAGYDCLISENWINGVVIPPGSRLDVFTKLLENFYKYKGETLLDVAEQFRKDFPIVFFTRIVRDLFFELDWDVERLNILKDDPEKSKIKPLSRKDFNPNKTELDYPPVIRKNIDRFEKQLSEAHPEASHKKIHGELVTIVVKWSKKYSKELNNFEKISEREGTLRWLIKNIPMKRKKPGQKKGDFKGGNEFDFKKLSKKEKDEYKNEYVDLLKSVNQIKKYRRLKKENPSSLRETLPSQEFNLIDFAQPSHKSAFKIWQSRHPHLADSLRTFRRRFPKK